MTKFLKVLNKYVILLIISSLFGMPWLYVRHLIFDMNNYETYNLLDAIPGYINYLVRLVIIILLIIDFRKENLRYLVLTCVATLFYPVLGVVILSLLLLEKGKEKACVWLWTNANYWKQALFIYIYGAKQRKPHAFSWKIWYYHEDQNHLYTATIDHGPGPDNL